MEAGSGSGPDDLTHFRQLIDDPTRYHLFHALRVIEAHYRDSPRLGESRTAAQDRVRLGQLPELAFPPTTLTAFQPAAGNRPARLTNLFFGLWGPHGPLPLHMTEYARDRMRNHRDSTMVAFTDMLTHRAMSLLYRVWAAAQPAAAFDRAWVSLAEEAEALLRDVAEAEAAASAQTGAGDADAANSDATQAFGPGRLEAAEGAGPAMPLDAGIAGAAGQGQGWLPEDALDDWDLLVSAPQGAAGPGSDAPSFGTQAAGQSLSSGSIGGGDNSARSVTGAATDVTGRAKEGDSFGRDGHATDRPGSASSDLNPVASTNAPGSSPPPVPAETLPAALEDDDFERTVILPRRRVVEPPAAGPQAGAGTNPSAGTFAGPARTVDHLVGPFDAPSGAAEAAALDPSSASADAPLSVDAAMEATRSRSPFETGSPPLDGQPSAGSAAPEGAHGPMAAAEAMRGPFTAGHAASTSTVSRPTSAESGFGLAEASQDAESTIVPVRSEASATSTQRDAAEAAGASGAVASDDGLNWTQGAAPASPDDPRPEDERTVIPFRRGAQGSGHSDGAAQGSVSPQGGPNAPRDLSGQADAYPAARADDAPRDGSYAAARVGGAGRTPAAPEAGLTPTRGTGPFGSGADVGADAASSPKPRPAAAGSPRSPFNPAVAGRLAERGLADPAVYAPSEALDADEMEWLGLTPSQTESDPAPEARQTDLTDPSSDFDAFLEPFEAEPEINDANAKANPGASAARMPGKAHAPQGGLHLSPGARSLSFKLLPRPNRRGHLDLSRDFLQKKVAALTGYANSTMLGADAMPDVSKRFFAGLLSSGPKNAEGLRAILEHFFEAKFTIQQFIGQWLDLEKDDTWQLGKTALGRGTSVGQKVWSRDSKFRIQVGPLDLKDYQRLLPGRGAIERMESIVRNYVGDRLAWDVQLILKADQVPQAILGNNVGLGYNSWMGSRLATQKDADDLTLTPPSQTKAARALAGH